MNTYAEDLSTLMNALDVRDAVMIGHSTGGGELTRYIGRYGTGRVSRIILVSAIPPLVLKTDANPEGTPKEALDGLRAGMMADRSQVYREMAAGPFFGFNRPGAKVSQGLQDSFWLQSMMGGHANQIECTRTLSETDFTEDLKRFDVPTLIVHGSDDQIVPIAASAHKSSKLVPGAVLKVYEGAPHGIPSTNAEQLNRDILEFIRS
jgi:non-heme chloroperoxidase